MIGRTLSHYRVSTALGAGGMGAVYRATDTRLDREVAIKVLPPEVAADPRRLSRLRREAHLLASLNHPNIAAIYGLEEADGQPFLALELVEGETLEQRLARGAIPVDEALEIARQIAEALEEAHGKGIVHRDLKPANVKLTPEGRVKVLDFGLAKAWAAEPAAPADDPGSSAAATEARTATLAGAILGTGPYMAPEQARGRRVDKRADVWSFGVLLWEMLTGRFLFSGDTLTDVIAAVVTKEPDLAALPARTPPAIRRLVARCLRKDPRMRLPDIAAARLDLQDALSGVHDEPSSPTTATGRRRYERWAWLVALLLVSSLAAYLALRGLGRAPDARPAAHFVLELPDGLTVAPWGPPAVSFDGRQVAFAATTAAKQTRLWVRALATLAIREIPGTDDGVAPFWSPDGRSLAFFADGELRSVRLADGVVLRICALPRGHAAGGDWAEDGTILFSAGGMAARLYTVPATGGEARPFTTPDEARSEVAHFWPRLLPGDRRFLFQVYARRPEHSGLFQGSRDDPRERRRVLPGLTRAEFRDGQLLFVRERSILALPLDVSRGLGPGEPFTIASTLAVSPEQPEWGWFSASSNGVLAWTEGQSDGSELLWRDRSGARLGAIGEPGVYGQLALSPDERQIALEVGSPEPAGGFDIWTIDLARGVGTRQTSDVANDIDPTWAGDGDELFFGTYRDGTNRIYRTTLQGNEPEKPLGGSPVDAWPEGWLADSNALLYVRKSGGRAAFEALDRSGEGSPLRILDAGHELDEPQVSPDGRWLAYASQETGRWEVLVQPFRRQGERVRISPAGGGQPKWRRDGKELFYVAPDGQLMAVGVEPADERVTVTLPRPLFGGVNPDPIRDRYAVTKDGQRFLVVTPIRNAPSPRIHVLTSWPSLLDRP
jgi:Tol biopolymer transport system component